VFVISAFGSQRQEDLEFEDSLDYIQRDTVPKKGGGSTETLDTFNHFQNNLTNTQMPSFLIDGLIVSFDLILLTIVKFICSCLRERIKYLGLFLAMEFDYK
jgi:hypothetical protein